MQFCNRTMIN